MYVPIHEFQDRVQYIITQQCKLTTSCLTGPLTPDPCTGPLTPAQRCTILRGVLLRIYKLYLYLVQFTSMAMQEYIWFYIFVATLYYLSPKRIW